MKRILCVFLLLVLIIPSTAFAFENATRYDFGHGEYYIWLPNHYAVMHENATEEELRQNQMYAAGGAKKFLDSFGISLFSKWDSDRKSLIINIYEDMFHEDVELVDRSSTELFIKDWVSIMENEGRFILFTEPVTGEYNNYGKISNILHDESGTTYYIDYILICGKDIINLTFSCDYSQFNIEEGHVFDTIVDRTGSYISSFDEIG